MGGFPYWKILEGEGHAERDIAVRAVEGYTLLAQLTEEAVGGDVEIEVGSLETERTTSGHTCTGDSTLHSNHFAGCTPTLSIPWCQEYLPWMREV